MKFFRDIPEDVLNTYCWIHSTYTVVDAFMKKQGLEVPFPGVENSQGGRGTLTIKHNKYYQWVAFTLFFQVRKFSKKKIFLYKNYQLRAIMKLCDFKRCCFNLKFLKCAMHGVTAGKYGTFR